MKALMYGHKGREAALIVENFLKNNPDYPENLRNKALEASWVLLKQVPYVAAPVKAPTKPKSVAATATKKKK